MNFEAPKSNGLNADAVTRWRDEPQWHVSRSRNSRQRRIGNPIWHAMNIRGLLYRAYWKVENAILPGFRAPQTRYEDLLMEYVKPGTRWLDVGAGHQVLSSWRLSDEKELVGRSGMVVGIDAHLDSLRMHRTVHLKCQGDLARLPFRSNTFDLITANMVVEHLRQPDIQFREIFRTLRPGGHFIFHTPNSRSYSAFLAAHVPEVAKRGLIRALDGRSSQDVFRTYYKANTQDAIRALANSIGFEVSKLDMASGSAESAMVLPVAVVELMFIKLLTTDRFQNSRTNIIAILRKG